VEIPQLKNWPAVTHRKLMSPLTATGVSCWLVDPSPSSPQGFQPQQKACSPVVTPQVCEAPAAIDLNARSPWTGTGENRTAVDPSPNWPLLLFPQQNAAPDDSTAHV
jgi:hypothetical protein